MFAIPDSAFRAAYEATGIRPERHVWIHETTEIRCGCPLGVLIYQLVGQEQATYICGNDDYRRMAEILNYHHYLVTPEELRAFVDGVDGEEFSDSKFQYQSADIAYEAGKRVYQDIIAPLERQAYALVLACVP